MENLLSCLYVFCLLTTVYLLTRSPASGEYAYARQNDSLSSEASFAKTHVYCHLTEAPFVFHPPQADNKTIIKTHCMNLICNINYNILQYYHFIMLHIEDSIPYAIPPRRTGTLLAHILLVWNRRLPPERL